MKTALQDMVEEHSKNEEMMKTQRGEMHEALVASLKALASGSNSLTPVNANASAIEALKLLAGNPSGDNIGVNVSSAETPPAP